jgi:hypothetical protein
MSEQHNPLGRLGHGHIGVERHAGSGNLHALLDEVHGDHPLVDGPELPSA